MRTIRLSIALALILHVLLLAGSPVEAANRWLLSFEERVGAQRAIEEVYWRHRVWSEESPEPKPALAEVLSDDAVRAGVGDYLAKSNALETIWWQPIDADLLQAELDRMARDTCDPELLRELFAALGDDPDVIAEILVRPVLAERLINHAFVRDERLHADRRREVESALAATRTTAELSAFGANVREIRWELWNDEEFDRTPIGVSAAGWAQLVDRLAVAFGGESEFAPHASEAELLRSAFRQHAAIPVDTRSAIVEYDDRFEVTEILSKDTDALTAIVASWPKLAFDTWWQDERAKHESHFVVEHVGFKLPVIDGSRANESFHCSSTRVAQGRYGPTAVWSPSEMTVRGGTVGNVERRDDIRYATQTSTWRSTAEALPVIEFQPTPRTAILGGIARFTVIASGAPPLTYQWRKDGADLEDGGSVSGSTTDVLTLTAVLFDAAAAYSVVVSNAAGDATSVDAALSVTPPQGGDIDFSFDPGSSVSGIVRAVVFQSDGRMLVGGEFTSIIGASRGRIARLSPDGSADHTFGDGLVGANGTVRCIAVQPDDRVLIGGSFTTVNGVSRNRVARLNADGSLDTTFLDGLVGANNVVHVLAVQPDGRVLIGGEFTTVNGVSRSRVARLNADGSLDTTFLDGLTGASAPVRSVVVQSDGRVLIGGEFSQVNGVNRFRIARLNVDGSLDTSFLNGLSGANNTILTLAVQLDGRVLIGGSFTVVNGVGRGRIARLNVDGSLDTSFLNGLAGASSSPTSIALLPDGQLLLGGNFTTVNGSSRGRVARLNADGSLDDTFLTGLEGTNDAVQSLAVGPDGRVLLGGTFTAVNGVGRNRVARLNADGSLDTIFLSGPTGANGAVLSLAVQPDGRVLIGGEFTLVNGISRNGVARLNADGSLDASFLPGLEGAGNIVYCLAVQPDGRVLIGGFFTTVNGVTRNRFARLNADGSLDTTFLNGLAGANGNVRAIAVQPDGRVLIGGFFTTINGVSRNRVARLNADGSLDTTFLNGPQGALGRVHSLALQPDGRVLIGGDFTWVNEASRNRVARLNADGSLDATFLNGLEGADNVVESVALQSDGRVLIGGSFLRINGVLLTRVARLNTDGSLDTTFLNGLAGPNNVVQSVASQPDGRVLIGGMFTSVGGVSRGRVARLNADRSLDIIFLDGLSGANSIINALVLQSDGRVLIGGSFTSINGVSGDRVARLHASTPVAPAVTVEPSAQAAYEGCCAVFHVIATGTPLDYRWRKDGMDLEDGPGINGAHAATLTLTGVTSSDEGDYSVVVSNFVGSDTSIDVPLTMATAVIPDCKVATCHPVFGCVLSNVLDGSACDDGDACTLADMCSAGACVGGVPPVCDDSNVCTDDSCGSPTGCIFTDNTAACDDGDVCTTADTCSAGACLGGAPLVCDDSDVCTEDACNPATGCVFTNNTAACDDGDPCTAADTCWVGICIGQQDCATIDIQPTPQATSLGGLARFTVIATGTPPLIYQWRKDGADLEDGGTISGAATEVLTLTDVRFDDAADYSVFVSNASGEDTSVDAALSVTTPQGGDIDYSFDVGSSINGVIQAVALQSDGRLLVGGSFTSLSGAMRGRVARLNPDGSTDHTFGGGLSGANGNVRSLLVQPDGRVLIGGDFTTVNEVSRNRVARLNADGSLDTTFLNELAGANFEVHALALQPDYRVLIGGKFSTVNGMNRGYVARLNADGSLDTTFLERLAGANSWIHALAVQPDDRVPIGGVFTTVNGVLRAFIARLNADGSLDTTFPNGPEGTNSWVYALAVQADGRVLIGGDFTSVNGLGRDHVARLNVDGSLDTTFLNELVGPDSEVRSLAVQSDGRVLIGGGFASVDGMSRNRLARLNVDGSLDTTFLSGLSGANSAVLSLAVQPDGRVLIGGWFTTVNGVPRRSIARLHGAASVAPSIVVEPSAQATYDGCCAVFHVTATGAPIDYRWRKDGLDLEDGPGISGTHTATLTLTGVTDNDGDYSVVVSNLLGSDTSIDAALTVAAVPECKVATCDPVLGCLLVDALDGTFCDDGNACTTADSCSTGACAAGDPVPAPPPVGDSLRLGTSEGETTLLWNHPSALSYNVYRGARLTDDSWSYNHNCFNGPTGDTNMIEPEAPSASELFYYLVSHVDDCGESTAGENSAGEPIPTAGTCP